MNTAGSRQLFERARQVLPGGVNSPVRAFGAVGGDPVFIERGSGSRLRDVDGNEYIDFLSSWGPLLLGHAAEKIHAAVAAALERGTTYGLPTEGEVLLAEKIVAMVEAVEMVRLVCSGTEACMSAIRLARGATGRDLIVKFDGCYHGHADSLLASAGSGVATFGIPGTPGVTHAAARDTLVLPFGDGDRAARLLRERGDRVAAVIVEPVAGNMGVVPPPAGFLETLRAETERCGALLIFDEVITGFRIARGGASERFGVRPDLVTLGKIIGGGFPIGAYGGRSELMRQMAPEGPVYQAGTLAGNPVAVAAGLAMLDEIARPGFLERLEGTAAGFFGRIEELIAGQGGGLCLNHFSTMGTLFFCAGPVGSFSAAKRADTERFGRYHRRMREQGIMLPPSQFEAFFLSAAHSAADLDAFLAALPAALHS